ncbi:MAG: DUF4058 family protein [Planctomycetes bacterium]|nr:DUF4058 family protein [Planctomycetota bacterium]
MESPFAGMDPYLEPHWLDVHTKLVTYAADELNRVLPETLVARTEERVAVESDWDGGRRIGSDVRVFSPASADPTAGGSGVAVDAPFKLVLELDPVIERFIRILDASGRLVTVIEFLSPTNKSGQGLEAYREKRSELLAAGVNLVEVDLVRQGDWRALLRPHVCPRDALATYRVTIRTPPGVAVYFFPARLRDKLPDVPVPLRPGDPRVVLPLQRLVGELYSNGRYGLTLDYGQPCDPPLKGDDAAAAEELLRRAGKRS